MTRPLFPLTRTDSAWIAGMAAYYAFHAVYRVAIGGSLGLDEAGIYLDGQVWALGYGPQLPLYAWLQALVFTVTGAGLAGMAGLKAVLLFATALLFYAMLRQGNPPARAGLAVAVLLTLPQFSWENQRALTHSSLALLCAAGTLLAFWRAMQAPGRGTAVVLGLSIGFGLLSKYNYALVPVLLLLTALSLPEWRGRIVDRRLLAAPALAAVIVAAPYAWVVLNPDIAFASADKLRIVDHALLPGIGMSLLAAAEAIVGFLVLPALMALVLWAVWRRRAEAAPPAADGGIERFLWRYGLITVVLVVVLTVVSGATEIRDRWLLPVLTLCVPALGLWLQRVLTETGNRRLVQGLAGLAILVVVGLPVNMLAGRAYQAAPFGTLAPAIAADWPEPTHLVARGWVAGNLAYALGGRTALDMNRQRLPDDAKAVLVFAEEDRARVLDNFAASPNAGRFAPDFDALRRYEAPYRIARDETFALLAVPLVPLGR